MQLSIRNIFFGRSHLYDLFFSVDRIPHRLKSLEPYETVAIVSCAEAFVVFTMLLGPPSNTVRHPAIESMAATCHDVDVVVVSTVGHCGYAESETQMSPLRYASVEMTKGRFEA